MTEPREELAAELRTVTHRACRVVNSAPWAALDEDERTAYFALADHVTALIAAAKAEERSHIIAIVDVHAASLAANENDERGYGYSNACRDIAAAIRSRKEDNADV